MESIGQAFVQSAVQCWGCEIFDTLFIVMSQAAAAMYRPMALFGMLLFAALLAFYVLNAVWMHIKPGAKAFGYVKQFKPIIINSLVVFALLGIGITFPRFMTTATFEPVTHMTILYTEAMLNQTQESVNERVTYQVQPMTDDGFYRPQLRDGIIRLMKTSITQFQAMMNLGIAIIDGGFSWSAFKGWGNLVQHIVMVFMGIFILYSFFMIFIKFCFYFIDVIVATTFFAFLFPLSLTFFAFQKTNSNNWWLSGLGKGLGTAQFKKVINSIVTLGAAVITYVVIMAIIAKFFSVAGGDGSILAEAIQTGKLYSGDLSTDNMAAITLTGVIVLVYIIRFMMDRIGLVSQELMKAFDIQEEHSLADQAFKEVEDRTGDLKKVGSSIGNAIKGKKPDAPAATPGATAAPAANTPPPATNP